jgi:hypothetical protein
MQRRIMVFCNERDQKTAYVQMRSAVVLGDLHRHHQSMCADGLENGIVAKRSEYGPMAVVLAQAVSHVDGTQPIYDAIDVSPTGHLRTSPARKKKTPPEYTTVPIDVEPLDGVSTEDDTASGRSSQMLARELDSDEDVSHSDVSMGKQIYDKVTQPLD